MRQRILTLGLILVARTLFAQEAVNRDSIGAGQTPAFAITAPVSGNAWIDLRQNAKPGAVQNAPDWVEAVTFIPAGTQADAAVPSVFRIRLARRGGRATVLFFRLFFNDQTSARPEIVAWDEAGSQDAVPQPFAATLPLHAPAQDAEEFGTVTAPLSTDLIRIGSASSQAATFEFGLESQPLLALITFEIAGARLDSPPEVIANGENVGPASLVMPGLADPGYRGEMHAIVSQMQFQYTGWLRAQKIVPVSALRTGTNNITIINGPNAAGAVIRATQIQLKYLWDKSDYILKPDR